MLPPLVERAERPAKLTNHAYAGPGRQGEEKARACARQPAVWMGVLDADTFMVPVPMDSPSSASACCADCSDANSIQAKRPLLRTACTCARAAARLRGRARAGLTRPARSARGAHLADVRKVLCQRLLRDLLKRQPAHMDGALHAVRVVAAHDAGAGAAARHAHADLALKDVHPVQQQRRVGLRSGPSVGAATGYRPAASNDVVAASSAVQGPLRLSRAA